MYRILIIDDNHINLEVTARMLQLTGHGIDTAANGEDAVKMAANWRYDLIVMDMAMPGIGGGEATRLIRQAERESGTRRVPVVAFTANNVEEFRQNAMRSDMDDFISKPIERRQLLAAIERSLDNRCVVLVADDSAANRERTLRALRALPEINVAATGVNTGAAAISACARQRVDFALINLSLPDTSGIEAASRIRSKRNGESVRIVAISDTADPEARKHSLREGCVAFLEKPFGQDEILALFQPLPA